MNRLQIIENVKQKSFVLVDTRYKKTLFEHENIQLIENKKDSLEWLIQCGLSLYVK